MFSQQLAEAIGAARTLTRLDDLSRAIWQGMTAGAVGDDDAQALAETLHTRRSVLRGDIKPVGIPAGRASIFPPRRLQRPPVRSVAIARRRHLAASGPMPPTLACRFTTGELAVLRIVGDEVRERGHCDRTLAELAARAGVCRTLAKSVMRRAAQDGLVTIEERRREGRRNLPNVVRVVSREWLQWLAKRPRSERQPRTLVLTGGKKNAPTDREYKKALRNEAARSAHSLEARRTDQQQQRSPESLESRQR
jgi:hypothetical protein